jgi:NADPH-dependent 2,4-dienoyl-CoA reductase/sulfur reductase-like enzyme/nitrite reductase/ring-hydroxylating ferredoxin subunit
MSAAGDPTGPDLSAWFRLDAIPDGGTLEGRVGNDAVLLVRQGGRVSAIGAYCTHYGAPLAAGIVTDVGVHCPWHHACFSTRTGDATRPPALRPLSRWVVHRTLDLVRVGKRLPPADPELQGVHPSPRARTAFDRIIIVGGGAAGSAAAEMLRREGYQRSIVIVDRDTDAPYDRPNISKDYLAGTAPKEWLPLHDEAFDETHGIERRHGHVAVLGPRTQSISLTRGTELRYDALILATGASARRLPRSIDPWERVHYLRTLRDSRAIIAAAHGTDRAIILGASFVGLEVAAALRTRGLDVHVVGPEARPLERILGKDLGHFVQRIHEDQGVRFHLGRTAASVDAAGVTLDNGDRLEGTLVIAGVGARPNSELALAARLEGGPGVHVDRFLATSAPRVYAAGDIAWWPDAGSDARIHVEHWAVAQRQGQVAALNVLGARQAYDTTPFFWSAHYDLTIRYVGHAERWDSAIVTGDLSARDGRVDFHVDGRLAAVATVGRDRDSLEAEIAIGNAHEWGRPLAST